MLYLESVICKCYPALGSYHVLYSDNHKNIFRTYSFSCSLTAEYSAIPRPGDGGCSGGNEPSQGSSLPTLWASRKHLDLPRVYYESTFYVGATLCLAICPWQPISLRSFGNLEGVLQPGHIHFPMSTWQFWTR